MRENYESRGDSNENGDAENWGNELQAGEMPGRDGGSGCGDDAGG